MVDGVVSVGAFVASHWNWIDECRLLRDGGKPRAMEEQPFDNYGAKIDTAVEESAKRLGRETKNFEDTIRVANELLRGMRIQGVGKAADKLEAEIKDKLSGLVKDLLANEKHSRMIKSGSRGTCSATS